MIIDTDQVFKELTKQNGKKFAKIIRGDTDAVSRGALRANLLNTPDLVSMLQYAGKDPNDAIRLIPVIKEIHDRFFNPPEIKQQHIEDPIKLLNKAGYDAFYVKTLRQQNSIAKYFEPKEKLCTFNDPYRYKENYIIHAVKKNIQNIKRSSIPQRDDEYGTSVISIQIRKKGGVIS
ncbi:MAG: hypothetical protein K5912_01630, partial [Alphaproteobacteria bacterium]|nr:hypothetical protein [Alphaproteobacteria bacterium]